MNTENATKEDMRMLFDLIKDFKTDVDKRFEQVDKRFEQVDKRFERAEMKLRDFEQDVKEEFKDIKYDLRLDTKKLEKVYESRDKVTVSFTRAWATASFFLALISSTIVLAVVKAF